MKQPAFRKKINIKGRKVKEALTGYLCILPMVIGFLVFTFVPLIYTFVGSFHDMSNFTFEMDGSNFLGLANFQALFKDANFTKAISNTFYLMMGIPVGMVLSFVLATLINSKYSRFKKPYLIIYYLPAVSSAIAVGIVWKWLFNSDYGPINQIFGTSVKWLVDPQIVKITLIMKGVWGGLGGTMLLYFAAMQNVPSELYEVADIEGGNMWWKTFNITIPLVKETTFYVLITAVIGGLLAFADNYIIVNSSSANTIVYYLWNQMKKGEYGLVCAGAVLLFVMVALFTLILFKVLRVGTGRQATKMAKTKKPKAKEASLHV
jgi:multiple sugar transport system permease protein